MTMIIKLRKNENEINILLWTLVMPVYLNVFNVLINQIGLGQNGASMVTALFYICLLLLTVTTCRITISDIKILAGIYSCFIINYFAFPDTRTFIIQQGMLILYFFIFPICVIAVRKITSWEKFMHLMAIHSVRAIFVAAIMMLFLDYEKYLIYMGFSYALLPTVCASYHSFRRRTYECDSDNKKLIYLCSFLIGLIEILAYGSRAAVIFSLMYVLAYELTRVDIISTRKFIVLTLMLICVVFVGVFFESILIFLSKSSVFGNSYLIRRALEGELFESSSRLQIAEICIDRIKTMGLSVSGLFGDRLWMGHGQAYPHNIVLELLMSLGWILGMGVIIIIASLIIVNLKKKDYRREISVYIVCTIMLKFLVSGSYVEDSRFWIAIFMLISLKSRKNVRKRKDITYEQYIRS